LNLRPLGYEPPEACPAVRISSHTSHAVSAYTARPSHRVSAVPAHHTTSYYRFDYSPRLAHPGSYYGAPQGGCLHCVDPRQTAKHHGDDAHGDTAPQTATFCVALSGETLAVVDHVRARERRGRRCRPPTRCRGATTSKIIAVARTPTTPSLLRVEACMPTFSLPISTLTRRQWFPRSSRRCHRPR
jgi:hypothetical protein